MTRLGSTVEASSSASSAASPATLTTTNVVEHPSFEIVLTDDVPEYGAACIIACDKCDKSHVIACNIACDKCDKCDIACDKCDICRIKTYDCLMSENSLGIFLSGLQLGLHKRRLLYDFSSYVGSMRHIPKKIRSAALSTATQPWLSTALPTRRHNSRGS